MRAYTTKSGVQQFKPSLKEVEDGMDDNQGFCLACGEIADGVEPDTRKDKCDGCGAFKVYGFEELVLMGLVYTGEE